MTIETACVIGSMSAAAGGDLADPGDGAQDHLQLAGEQLEFGVGHRQPGQLGQMGDIVAADGLDFGGAGHDRLV